MDATSLHPTDQTLSAYGLGKLDDGSVEAVNKHLEECAECRKRVAEMPADSFLNRVRGAQDAGKSLFGQSLGTQNLQGSKPPPAAETLPPGLADHPDYRIKQELGRGGMGVVYLAHNTLMGRDEVLKVMGRQIMERPGVLDRFLREIRAVAKLRHANIVTAYAATRIGESIVFAMEYVEGLDLSRLVKAKGPLPVGHSCNFVYQAALGLQHAHEEGLVHRDIKPANLMLSRKGEKAVVKVLDFGLAKVAREERVDSGLTSEGQALGTPDYIAPEQILNATSADIRADIYSLGGTLYYLLTGHPPFRANSLYDLYQAHISRDADPLNFVRPEVPSELAALIAKMMAKDPDRRFQTPGEVAQALVPFFKKTNVAQAAQTNSTAESSPATRLETSRAQPILDGSIQADQSTNKPTQNEVKWDSLVELKEHDVPIKRESSLNPTKKPPWRSKPVAIATSFLFGLIALGVIVITIKNKDGRETKVIVPEGTSSVVIEESREDTPNKLRENAPAVPSQGDTSGISKATKHPIDKLQAGTAWSGTGKIMSSNLGRQPDYGLTFTITERDGNKFKGRETHDEGDAIREFAGEIDPNSGKFSFKFTRTVKGKPIDDPVEGTVTDDFMDFRCNWTRNDLTLTAWGRLKLEFPVKNLTKPEEIKDAGLNDFEPLFNGKDLSGWTFPYGNGADWKVEQGELRVDRATGGYCTIATKRADYSDFRLRLEFLKNDRGNAHIVFRSQASTDNADHSANYRFQLGGNRVGGQSPAPVGNYYFNPKGSRTSLEGFTQDGLEELTAPGGPLPSRGDWHVAEVNARGNEFHMLIDGKKVSAFRDTKSRLDKGSIEIRLLQGSTISIRKIEIKELTKPEEIKKADIKGFVPLFNGKHLDGWIDESGGAVWSVENATLIGRKSASRFAILATQRKDYTNYFYCVPALTRCK